MTHYSDENEGVFKALMKRSHQWLVVVWDMRAVGASSGAGAMGVGDGASRGGGQVNGSDIDLPWEYIKYEMESVVLLLAEHTAKKIVKKVIVCVLLADNNNKLFIIKPM